MAKQSSRRDLISENAILTRYPSSRSRNTIYDGQHLFFLLLFFSSSHRLTLTQTLFFIYPIFNGIVFPCSSYYDDVEIRPSDERKALRFTSLSPLFYPDSLSAPPLQFWFMSCHQLYILPIF